jgi:hypothetical protein
MTESNLNGKTILAVDDESDVLMVLEDVLRYENLPGWSRLFQNFLGFFNAKWGENWKKTDEKFWKEFDEKIAFIKK